MDESKPLEELRNWEHPLRYGCDQVEERVTLTFLENQKGLFHTFMTHFRMPVKREMFCEHVGKLHKPPSRWTQSQTLLAERRIIPIPLKYIDVTRTTHTNLDVKQEKRIDDYWKIDGLGIFQILGHVSLTVLFRRETSNRIYVVRCETDKNAADIQARLFMVITLDGIVKKCQTEGEVKVVTWKTTTR